MPLVSDSVAQNTPGLEQENRPNRRFNIRRAAVLGAGTMGARIAAHIANAGLPVLLLDIIPEKGDHNSLTAAALNTLKSAKPAAFAVGSIASNISVGNFVDDLPRLKDCDWIIEAVAENLEIKRNLLSKVAPYLHAEAILTTNTSGLPVAQIGAQLPDALRPRWFGTHFFNPPRYMRLLEVIATPETDPAAVAAIADFADRQLGKTVVPANDVPNFIANRVGTFVMMNTVKIMQEQGLSIEEIDVLTGPVIGWPKTGTFRLADMVGLDVLGSVAQNFSKAATDERSDVKLPQVIEQLIERKWLGDKTKQGFYKKERGADGKEVRSVLNLETFEYRPAAKPNFPSVELAKSNESIAGRLRALLDADPGKDRAAKFYWRVLPELWAYAANRIGEVTETIVDIDRAMTSGFNWELGPFALWDAAGVPKTVEKMRAAGTAIPPAVEKLLASGGTSWYRADGTEYFDVKTGAYRPAHQNPELDSVASYKRPGHKQTNGVFAENSSISLVDIGDGIGCFEFHSKMNSLGFDIVSFLLQKLQPGSDAVRNFDGFIITNDAESFTVGANLMQLLLAIQDDEWDDIDHSVRQFQGMTQAIKFCQRPVVAAPFGLCLGGGTETMMHAALRQPHLELYAGLVETGVGLIPGGGGCKEMLLRALSAADAVRSDARGESVEVIETLKNVFETIAMAKVSTSAIDARSLRIIEDIDSISMNRSRLVNDAKAQALRLAHSGYTAPVVKTNIPAPGETIQATLKLGVYLLREGAYISEHDAKVATHVARILTGGNVTQGTLLSEQNLLDLEREAFLSLCGESKTIERIQFTLKTGKPLRN
jgi:3-hydroxyacyl-CoA dehydrogenase